MFEGFKSSSFTVWGGGIGAAACSSLCGLSSRKGDSKAMNEGPLVNSALGIKA